MAETGAALPSQRYAAGAARGEWQDDPAQHPALRELDRIHEAVVGSHANGFLGRLLGREREPPRGLYLWGGVGRGKTFLVDLFFDGLPIAEKRRTHFHRFMRAVHESLHEHAGKRDPLAAIAREWRARLRVLVLDEFFVTDIGDAMLLGRLLERLFAEGVVLLTSSNIAPAGRGWEFDAITPPDCPWLVIQGEADEIVDPAAVYAWLDGLKGLKNTPELVRMPETSHFFHRRLMDLRGAVKNGVRPYLPAVATMPDD